MATHDLTIDDPLIFLTRRILKTELESFRSSLLREGKTPGPSDVHRARIALRRIRVALRFVVDIVPAEAEEFRAGFRWVGRALGEIRDLDVYAESTGAADGGEPSATTARSDLEQSINAERTKACKKLNELLESGRFAELESAFSEFVDREPSPRVQRRWRSLRIRDAARGDVRESLKRVQKLGKKIDSDSPPEMLHKLRIRAKRLRYAAEFYADFFPELPALARAAKRLQDVLGAYRDACDAADRLREFGQQDEHTEPGAAVALILRRQNERAAAGRREFAAAWQRFEKVVAKTKTADKRS
jgi:CHAD domain-containing protein